METAMLAGNKVEYISREPSGLSLETNAVWNEVSVR
jgi:hypothetical protein